VESSMLYFCSQVSQYSKAALTGECADEIFGGYPWFHKKEAFETDGFPWSADQSVRQSLLQEKWIRKLPMKEYAEEAYEKAVRETPCCTEDSSVEKRRREIAYLNLKWFMATLLDRMERTSTWCGLSARVPIADYRIIEYVWNVPWSVKCEDGIPKALLRRAGKGSTGRSTLEKEKSISENIQSAVRSTSGRPAERRSVTRYKCAHSGISGSKEGRAVFKFAEGLRKTVVRTADGRTSDDRICAADQLLDEKIPDPDQIVKKIRIAMGEKRSIINVNKKQGSLRIKQAERKLNRFDL